VRHLTCQSEPSCGWDIGCIEQVLLRTAAAVYICIALEPVILQLICTQNLVQVLIRYNISQVIACAHHLKFSALADPHSSQSIMRDSDTKA
jgi:hypothetical protein